MRPLFLPTQRRTTLNILKRTVCLLLALFLALPWAQAASPDPAPTVYGYREGLAQTTDGTLWGFSNTSGQIVVPIQYDSLTDFTLGLARVEKAHKLGIVRPDGIELIPARYDTLTHIGYGLYLAQDGDTWGVLSLLAFKDKNLGLTHEFLPFVYTSAQVTSRGNQEVLLLEGPSGDTVIPLTELPARMAAKNIPSSQFPLIKGHLPAFTDVGPRDWYALWSDLAYNLGLMEGVGNDRFAPNQILTVAEVLKLAAYLESQSIGDDFHLQPITASPWYSSSVAYCVATGIIKSGEFSNYSRPITRAEMVRILGATTLGRRLPQINDLNKAKTLIPDLKAGDYAAETIYSFYAKGLLNGTDGNLTFHPNGYLTRAEAAAVVSRMARAEQRVLLWGGELPYTMS